MIHKMLVKAAFVVAGSLAGGFLMGDAAQAVKFSSVGETVNYANVGSTIDSSQELGAGVGVVQGELSSHADLYKFSWEKDESGNAQDFNVRLAGQNSDLQLSLYRVGTPTGDSGADSLLRGVGLSSSDSSRLSVNNLYSGTYYLGVSSKDYVPVDAANNAVFSGNGTNWESTSTLSGWSWGNSASSTGTENYELKFSTATGDAANVPEPVTIIGTLLAGAYGISRKIKSRKRASSTT